jgi:hypothetical protein
MKNRCRPMPLLVLVAAAALALGSFGSATAAGLTLTQVKKVAAKVVDNKAPRLSVARAKSAKNANNLGGLPPAAYLDRAVSSFDTSGTGGGMSIPPGSGTATELRPAVTLASPSGVHAVHVTAGASFIAGAESDVSLWYTVDAPCTTLSGFGVDHRIVLNATAVISMGTLDVLQPLSGSHTFRLCANATLQTGALNSYITIETVATS